MFQKNKVSKGCLWCRKLEKCNSVTKTYWVTLFTRYKKYHFTSVKKKPQKPSKSWRSSRRQCFWKVENKPSLSFWQNVQDEWHKRFWILIAKINLVVFNITSPIRIVEHLAPPFFSSMLLLMTLVRLSCTNMWPLIVQWLGNMSEDLTSRVKILRPIRYSRHVLCPLSCMIKYLSFVTLLLKNSDKLMIKLYKC